VFQAGSSYVPLSNLNMAFPKFLLNKNAPLNLDQPMNAIPQDYLKLFAIFTGEGEVTIEKHIASFCAFAEKLNVEYLDVVMRFFVRSLDWEERKWFKTLPTNSINAWEELEKNFTQRLGEKKDHGYFLIDFNAIKRKLEEEVNEFIKKFNKMYNSFQEEIKPPPAGEKVVFTGAFDSDFGFSLRERRSPTLDQIHTDDLNLNRNETYYKYNHKYRDVAEITLHLINIRY